MTRRSAFLIGAYGADHVGDAAILGGVLLRLAHREKIERAVVASFRPERTRRLVALIEPSVPIEVVPHDLATLVDRHLRKADLLVWAGGPMGDRPRLLARNLRTVLVARARGVPFVVEGVGIGRLRRWVTRRLVSAILKLAQSVTVRSTAAATAVRRLAGRDALVGRDPSFDYIATRHVLNLTTPHERARIQEFTARAAGTLLVCINARPARRRAEQPMVAAALGRLAMALVQLARIRSVRYVFVPLEAEANTGADLEAASELARHLPPEIDFHIWRRRPGIDGLLTLLREADLALTVRLHAAIFALSQGVPTLAIEYSVGGPGKVSELFHDLGAGERAISLARLDSGNVVRILTELAR